MGMVMITSAHLALALPLPFVLACAAAPPLLTWCCVLLHTQIKLPPDALVFRGTSVKS